MCMLTTVIVMLGLCQTPRTMAEIRQSLNRFDDMDKIVLQAKAGEEVKVVISLPNKDRRAKVNERVRGFAALELSHPLPWLDAETAMMDDIVDTACKPFDVPVKQESVQPVFNWYQTKQGVVWGWYDETSGNINYYTQPVTVVTGCVGGKCKNYAYGR